MPQIWDPSQTPKENVKFILSMYVFSPPVFLLCWIIFISALWSYLLALEFNVSIRLLIVIFTIVFTWPFIRCFIAKWKIRKNKRAQAPKVEEFQLADQDLQGDLGKTEAGEIEAIKDRQRAKKGKNKRKKFAGKKDKQAKAGP